MIEDFPNEFLKWLHTSFPSVKMLIDSKFIIDGVMFYGTPWQPYFGGWGFNLPDLSDDLNKKYAVIPNEVSVLITHCPPQGILDTSYQKISTLSDLGCKSLKEWINHTELHPNLKIHAFGHIHSSNGVFKNGDVSFVNASIVDEDYNVSYEPITLDI